MLITVLQVPSYTAQVSWTAWEGVSDNVYAAIQTTKNSCFGGGALTGADSWNDGCGGP